MSQNITYARHIVDTLTSSYFEGRGVENQGEKKAATYIAKEFNRLGINPIDSTYFQEFNYPINTITGRLSVQIDDVILVAGKDYIVGANSSAIAGKFELVWYNKTNLPTNKQLKKLVERNFFMNKFIVIDDEGVDKDNELFQRLKLNFYGAAGLIFLEKKLTKHLSQSYQDYAVLHISKERMDRNTRSITLEINQKFIQNYQSQNVIGLVPGTLYPDSFIVFSAHYDHLGKMGDDVYFPGANDNASGVAMLLDLATYYARKEPPKKTMVFIAFGAEESGLVGSKYFVEHPTIELKKIKFEINLDVIGTGDEGIMVVNGAIHEKEFQRLQTINTKNNYVAAVKKRGKAANSDHYWFSEKGIPAFFIYALGGIAAYHDVDDVAKTLPLNEFEDCFRLIRDFVDEL
ncbi:MAG: M20/M25/M40 family metallo-hydrolase [Vicingus serpentipes]|nr:M20/M25/M40 family metallo-hydrolase [Vicingus serpentipes]